MYVSINLLTNRYTVKKIVGNINLIDLTFSKNLKVIYKNHFI